MAKSSEYIDHKAYIRYLRKVTGEQLNDSRIRKKVMEKILGNVQND